MEEVKSIQFRLDAALKDLVTSQEANAIKESETDVNIKYLEDTIHEKLKDIDRMKKEHLKEINDLKSVQTDNVDLNMKRLKKMYADLKKEKMQHSMVPFAVL